MPWTPPSQIIDYTGSRRAAQYVRMSTEHQKYSTENQAAAIAAYALRRSLKIVRTYIDSGRSGVSIISRQGLQDLLTDVQQGMADFEFILVYDVSRWGRFQDVDESAYYEFICKKNGIRVLYCEERFENDGSFVSAIMKNIRRVAAGDYSRDLSVRIFAATCRMVQRGFKPGGPVGYGLQRVLVDQSGKRRCILAPGEHKALQTDRVILQPGRPEEIETVRRVFRSFVFEKKSEFTIANELNDDGISNQFGRPWRMMAIRRMLSDEKYLGNYVYNRESTKLKGRKIFNPPEAWVRCENAFEGIIAPDTFRKAAKRIERRPPRTIRLWKSDQEMLALLRTVLQRHGRITARILDSSKGVPRSMTYIMRFGSLRRAYELIGYRPDGFRAFDARRAVIAVRVKVGHELTSEIQAAGTSAAYDRYYGRLIVARELTVSILVVRCLRSSTNFLRWPVRRQLDRAAKLLLAVRLKEDNASILDYFLISTRRIPKGTTLTFRRSHRAKLAPYRLLTIDAVAEAIQRVVATGHAQEKVHLVKAFRSTSA